MSFSANQVFLVDYIYESCLLIGRTTYSLSIGETGH